MIRTLLATTAIATLLSTGAFAQETTAPAAPAAPAADGATTAAPAESGASSDMQTGAMMGYLASNIIGETVYNGVIQGGGAMQGGEAAPVQSGEAAPAAPAADNTDAQDTEIVADGEAADPEMTTGDQAAEAVTGEATVETTADGQTVQTVETIGDVNDVVIGQNGQVEAIIVGVGGFLGIGEKNVALNFNEIQWARATDGDPYIVVNATRESLEALPDFDRSTYEQPMAETAMNTDGTAVTTTETATTTAGGMAPAAGTTADTAANTTETAANTATGTAPAEQPADNNMATTDTTAANTTTEPAATTTTTTTTDQTQTGAIDRSTLQELPQDQLTAETLVGTTVYGSNDENIGEIADIVLTQDGQVDAVLVDVGGFLGIGEKRVAVGMDRLQFLQDGNGNRYLYTNFTEEQLNAQAAYDEGTYSENRDQQRLIVQ